MGDRYYACITFGGELDKDAFEEIVEAIENDGLYAIDDSPLGDSGSIAAWLRDKAAAGEQAVLYDNEANYGRMEALELALKSNRIAFYIDAEPNSGGEYRDVYNPKGDPIERTTGTVDHDPAVTLSQLREHLKAGRSLADAVELLAPYDPEIPPVSLKAAP